MTTYSPEINIFSLEEAITYQPDRPTYAIRIFSPFSDDYLYSLEYSVLYTTVEEYFFDDMVPDMPFDTFSDSNDNYEPFTPDIAHTIISDFERHYDSENLLVHCKYGMNRSPAVAIALNDIFGLGYESELLQQNFLDYRESIYEMMIEQAITHFPSLLDGKKKRT